MLMSRPLNEYLQEIGLIQSSGVGVKETSYYPALSNLFNAVGKTLKPRVRCLINIANQGAGPPDGGFFTPDQFQRASEASPLTGQIPKRGVIEVKGTGEDIDKIADSTQVIKYWHWTSPPKAGAGLTVYEAFSYSAGDLYPSDE